LEETGVPIIAFFVPWARAMVVQPSRQGPVGSAKIGNR
jgi:hypothetical protein